MIVGILWYLKCLKSNNYYWFCADGDTLVFIDFRSDRMRQINEAFGIKPPFETDVIPKDLVSTINEQGIIRRINTGNK